MRRAAWPSRAGRSDPGVYCAAHPPHPWSRRVLLRTPRRRHRGLLGRPRHQRIRVGARRVLRARPDHPRQIQDSFEHDTLIEAIAVELERDHDFVYVSDDRLVAAVNVSTVETRTSSRNSKSSSRTTKRTTRRTTRPGGRTLDYRRPRRRSIGGRTRLAEARPDDRARPDARRLLAEQDLHDIAVVHLVGLALRAQPPVLARLGHRPERDEVLVGDGLGADEPLARSVWIAPAASTAVEPSGIGQARTSSGPAVRNETSPSRRYDRAMTRSSPDSAIPSSSMNTAASSGSSSPSSISILADSAVDHRVLVLVARRDARDQRRCAPARSPSPTLSSTRTGFWVRNRKPRIAFSSSASSPRSRIGVPAWRPAWMRAQDDVLALGGFALGRRPVTAAGLQALEPPLGHREVGEHELQIETLEVAGRVDAARRDAGCDGSSNARTTWSRASESRSRARWSAGSSSVPTWPSVEAAGPAGPRTSRRRGRSSSA